MTPSEGHLDKRAMIQVSHLSKKFVKRSKIAVIEDISFNVSDKELLTLFGPSGCGKTTTLRCVAGLEKPDEGEIRIGNQIVSSADKKIFVPPEKRNIGLVFQSYALWPNMTVFNNVAYGLKTKHVPKDEIRRRVSGILDVVELKGYEERYPSQLSGGQQQRVALARSLVYEPKVLLLDEPLSNLDAKIREKTRLELRSLLKEVGITTVYVTHDQEEAFQISDRIAVITQGRIQQVGSPYEIYHNPSNEFVASFVGQSNMIKGVVVSAERNSGERGASGTIRIFDNYDIVCSMPASLAPGSNCLVMIRPIEVGFYTNQPTENSIKCTLFSRSYKGALTDHIVRIGDTLLTVSTHRYCSLNDDQVSDSTTVNRYIVIRGDSVTIVPA